MLVVKAGDRCVSTACMQDYEKIERLAAVGLRYRDSMAQGRKDLLPTKSGDAVAVGRSWRRGSNDADTHGDCLRARTFGSLPIRLGALACKSFDRYSE